MGDMVIKGGTVVDGTGAPGVGADVRIQGGRITEVGPDLPVDGAAVLDASGAVVAPGFIDTHTHLDPSMFWDPACDPMPQHGVTTALIGNCSLSLAPVRPEHLDDLIDVFSYIEDIPLADFRDGVPWTWSTWREYRDAINDRGAGLNMASLIGHSMLRMYAMGDDAWTREARPDEVEAMCAELADALAAGCFGLSTSSFDVDRRGRPVPSRVADDVELRALAQTMADAGHGVVEFIPNLTGGDVHAELRHMAGILGPMGVTSVWNGLLYNENDPARSEGFMALTAELRAGGCDMWPVASPRTVDFNVNWDQTMLFMMLPEGWNRVMQVAGEERRELLADGAWRADARAEWDRQPKSMFPITRIDRVRFTSVAQPELEPWLGRSLADLVEERGGHPSDVFADWVLQNDLAPGVVAVGVSNGDVDGVAGLMADPRALISASDAGAHVQMMCAAGDTTLLLTRHVRDRGDLTLEQAVHELTGRQADVFGFHDRGRLAPGFAGDVTVFALDELDWGRDVFVDDLPSGAARLRRPPGGYRATVVNGVATQLGGELTGAAPGRVLEARRAS
jgi:N-acyl-D-amino-acid deacylase